MQQNVQSESPLIPSSERPVPLQGRNDLQFVKILFCGALYSVVKDPVALRYFRLQPEQTAILQSLNGQRSLQELRNLLQEEFPVTYITTADIQSLVTDLFEKNLLVSHRMGQGETVLKRKRDRFLGQLRQTLLNPTFIRFPGWDPDGLLTRLCPWCGWIFSLPGLLLFSLLILSSWFFVLIRFDEIRQRLPEFQQFFSWPNLIYLWLTMAGTKILHELGHGIACKYFHGECHSMGVVLMIFSPTMYCDVSDSWMMKNKWQRILISAAGMYIEMILSACAIFIWYHAREGLLQHLALNVFFISAVATLLFNVNPLLRYDGYYILSDLLEVPNLQEKSSRAFNRMFSQHVLGAEQPEDPFAPASGSVWLIAYFIASSVYRWIVLFGVATFLYTVLRPYRLQSLGILAAVFSLATAAGNSLTTLLKLILTPRRDPMSRMKLLTLLLLLIGSMSAFLWVPIPWYEQAACVIEPAGVQHLYALRTGVIKEIAVQPGTHVHSGDLLILMQSPELIDELEKLRTEMTAQDVELKLMAELKDPEGRSLAEQRLQSIGRQVGERERQLQQMQVIAPVSGRVIEPRRVPPKPMDAIHQRQLNPWSGTPLESRNLGMTLEAGSHICSIAPCIDFQATLFLHQRDREDLNPGDVVHLKLDSIPGRVLAGRVKAFSDRELEIIPSELSNKYGGPFPTTTGPAGQEHLSDPMYQATVEILSPPVVLTSGLRGNVRFVVYRRSLANWTWRTLRTLFHFRI